MQPEEDSLYIEAIQEEEHYRAWLECYDTKGRSWISKKKFDFKQGLHEPYLTRGNLAPTIEALRKVKFNANLFVKSSHGTAKTTGLVKVLIKEMQKMYNRKIRVLYLCNRRANVKKACKDLGLDYYLDENGKPLIQVIRKSIRLGICEHSLHQLFDENNFATHFDLVIYDESENAHFDAHSLSNRNQDNLKEIIGAATLRVFMDSDVGAHTYALCEAMNQETFRRMVLIENTYSHLLDSNHYFHTTESNVYPRIAELLEEGKLVSCLVGHKDTEKRPWLTAMDNVFNYLFGKQIAFHIDSKNTDKHKGLYAEPDNYIGELIDKGYRLFTHSPVIVTGWRYNGIPFDNHVGIHRSRILTAPSILQGARRFEGIKTFDYYIGANVNITETEKLEAAHSEGFKKKYSRSFQRDRDLSAEQRLQKYRSSIEQHMRYMISDYQGYAHFAKDYPEEVRADYLELCEDEQEEYKRERAEKIYENEDKRNALLGNFFGIAEIEDWEETQELLERDEHVRDNYDDIIELISLIFSTPEERVMWAHTKPYWMRQKDFTLPLIGNIVSRTLEQAGIETDTIKGMLQRRGDFEIILNKDRFADKEHTELMKRWRTTLDSKKGKWFNKIMTFPTFIKAMCEFLDLNVNWEAKGKGNVLDARDNLFREYGDKGFISKTLAYKASLSDAEKEYNANREEGDPAKKRHGVRSVTPMAHTLLEDRYIEGAELSDIEQTYIKTSGKYLEIQIKKGTHRAILNHLGLIDENFEKYATQDGDSVEQLKDKLEAQWKEMVALNEAHKLKLEEVNNVFKE